MVQKEKLTCLFHERLDTPQGKYLVKRRDGSVVEWPSFVLGGRDPLAPWALRLYGVLGFLSGHFTWSMTRSVWRWARFYDTYRRDKGVGDPGSDDPATIREMRRGMSA